MTALSQRAHRYETDHVRHLRALAYRMLGSRSDAEDVMQEVWLRWAEIDESSIDSPRAYLSRLATNLCLDRLRSAAVKREQYVGIWLPEPLLEDDDAMCHGPERQTEFAQDVSVAFMLALERLTPLERASFLLHDVFALEFDEVATRLERSPAACRQLASRARTHVKAEYVRCEVEADEHERLFNAFNRAVQSQDTDALASLLSEDAVLVADGGGKVTTIPRPLHGGSKIARTFMGFVRLPSSQNWHLQQASINGLPGCLVFDGPGGELVQTIILMPSPVDPGRIGTLYIQRNPEKLRHLSGE
ncbi:RNA polymerase sigma factor SigJ [Marinobacterium stanieri]|uniref:RNA polymerase sigma factor SigJ n=1 Tax=Marinobacterium stanieri TaxID=49186 RepID=UPI003A9378BA